jgi:hypothetical protein
MKLFEGVHHVTFLTEDIDRLVAFYERVFGAEKTLDMTEEGCGTSSSRSAPRLSCIRSRFSRGLRCRRPPGRCSSAAASITSPCWRPRRSVDHGVPRP